MYFVLVRSNVHQNECFKSNEKIRSPSFETKCILFIYWPMKKIYILAFDHKSYKGIGNQGT